MTGAINYPMSDIYGGFAGTTERTVPDADDQQALVDDQKASDTVNPGTSVSKGKMLLSVLLILILVVAIGGRS